MNLARKREQNRASFHRPAQVARRAALKEARKLYPVTGVWASTEASDDFTTPSPAEAALLALWKPQAKRWNEREQLARYHGADDAHNYTRPFPVSILSPMYFDEAACHFCGTHRRHRHDQSCVKCGRGGKWKPKKESIQC
jgi:hypothetical protein